MAFVHKCKGSWDHDASIGFGGLLQGTLPVAGKVVVPKFITAAKSHFTLAFETVSAKSLELLLKAKASLTSSQYWVRFAKIGTASAALRGAYDVLDTKALGNPKEPGTIAKNVGLAFLGGGLCSGVFTGPLAYHYVTLDVFGDFSQKYLVDIRKKHGDEKGEMSAAVLLAGENALATVAFVPYLGSWSKSVQTALLVTGISVGMETYLQHANGKDLEDVDPGRFVGMSAWGHTIVILPQAILGGAVKAVGLAASLERATELGLKYVVFVNPSVSNFSARVNNQNWGNVQIGNATRHATLMWGSRITQAVLGPANPISMIVDEGLGTFSIALVDKVWPFYEGVEGFDEESPGAPEKELSAELAWKNDVQTELASTLDKQDELAMVRR